MYFCQTVASIWGLVALTLADEEFLPFNYMSYALELQVYLIPEKMLLNGSQHIQVHERQQFSNTL